MQQLFARRYKTRLYKLEFGKSVVRTLTPEKSFGTILVGIAFASYLVPVVADQSPRTKSLHAPRSLGHPEFLTNGGLHGFSWPQSQDPKAR